MKITTVFLSTIMGLFFITIIIATAETVDHGLDQLSAPCDVLLIDHANQKESTPLLVAGVAGTTSCSCPETKCQHGTIAACSITCTSPKLAHCSCDSGCKTDGNTSGSNRCNC
jgi:hypothetical protein